MTVSEDRWCKWRCLDFTCGNISYSVLKIPRPPFSFWIHLDTFTWARECPCLKTLACQRASALPPRACDFSFGVLGAFWCSRAFRLLAAVCAQSYHLISIRRYQQGSVSSRLTVSGHTPVLCAPSFPPTRSNLLSLLFQRIKEKERD